jgi:hypothetical protein
VSHSVHDAGRKKYIETATELQVIGYFFNNASDLFSVYSGSIGSADKCNSFFTIDY